METVTTVVTISAANSTTTTMLPVRWGAVALVLIVIATAFGNILLCLAVMTERRLQNMTNYFLASLAVADLLVAIVVMPLAVVVEIYGQSLCAIIPVEFIIIIIICDKIKVTLSQ